MTRPQRLALRNGPQITIYINKLAVTDVFKRVAMALSPALNEHFTSDPTSLVFHIRSASLVPQAIRTLLVAWPEKNSKDFKASELQFQNTFHGDIALIYAARLLRMDKYVDSILRHYINYLNTRLPAYSEVIAIEQLRTSDEDPLWRTMIDHLTELRARHQIPDPIDFVFFLNSHPQIEKAMNATLEASRQTAHQAEEERRQQAARALYRHRNPDSNFGAPAGPPPGFSSGPPSSFLGPR